MAAAAGTLHGPRGMRRHGGRWIRMRFTLQEERSTPTAHPRGGLYFEDFAAGHFRHKLTRTVTQMDNMLFSNMTLNPQPLHIDADFCATETEWGRPLMNSLFTLGLMIGMSVNDLTVGTTIANLGMTDVVSPTRCSRATRSAPRRRFCRRGPRSRGPMRASSSSCTAPSCRTGGWSPNAG